VPVHQNLLYPTQEAAVAAQRGELDMRGCRQCGFVFNAAFDAELLEYGPEYENSQHHSAAFAEHLDAMVERIVHHHGVPYVEPFAWTRLGAPYYAYSWLPEITYYFLYAHGGPLALRTLHGLTFAAGGVAMAERFGRRRLGHPPAIGDLDVVPRSRRRTFWR